MAKRSIRGKVRVQGIFRDPAGSSVEATFKFRLGH